MKIIIEITEEGRFTVDKSEGLAVFTAIGMIELAKQMLLNKPSKQEELEGQLDMEEVIENEVQ